MKTYIDNPIFMEILDTLATDITELTFGENAYISSREEMKFTDKAQDYYNDMYDEYEGLFNNFEVYSSNEGTPKKQSDVIKELWSELQALKRTLIDNHRDVWSQIQNK
jgi:ClpP class serine protease